MEKLSETNVSSHHPFQPSFTDLSEDPLSEDRDMKGTIITRNPLTVSKLPCNAVWGIERATTKPNQRNTVVFEDAVDHGCNALPFHYPLDIKGGKTLQEFSEYRGVHLIVFELAVLIILGEILTRRDSRRMKQSKPLI